MFSKGVTNSSDFLMMSQSAQNLYFHFGMNADDDGFCEVFTVMRMTDSKPDDLKSLHEKGLVFVIDSKVCIVKDWHENNQIRLDRYKSSKYFEDPDIKQIYFTVMDEKVKEISHYKEMLNGWQPNGNQMAPQYRLGKVSIDKNINTANEVRKDPIAEIIFLFKNINPVFEEWYGNKTQRGAVKWLIEKFGFEEVSNMVSALPAINAKEYVTKSTTPWELKKNLGKLKAHFDQQKEKQPKNKLTIAI